MLMIKLINWLISALHATRMGVHKKSIGNEGRRMAGAWAREGRRPRVWCAPRVWQNSEFRLLQQRARRKEITAATPKHCSASMGVLPMAHARLLKAVRDRGRNTRRSAREGMRCSPRFCYSREGERFRHFERLLLWENSKASSADTPTSKN